MHVGAPWGVTELTGTHLNAFVEGGQVGGQADAQPGVRQRLLQAQPLFRVRHQQPLQQILACWGYLRSCDVTAH